MDYSQIITIEPGKRSGQPCIRGLRMTVQDVLEYLASGMTVEEILKDFPDLTGEDIRACLAFAADRERRLAWFPRHETVVRPESFREFGRTLAYGVSRLFPFAAAQSGGRRRLDRMGLRVRGGVHHRLERR